MAGDDLPVPHTHGAGGPHIVHLAVAQKLGPHIVGQAHPAEQAQQHQQQSQAWREYRRKNDQQIQLGHGTPDLNEPLKCQVGLAAEIPLHGPGQHTQHHAGEGQRQRKQHAHPETVDELGQQIAPPVIGTQPVVQAGGRRVGILCKIVQRFGAIGVGRIPGPVALGTELLADERVQVVGGRGKVATEGGFGVVGQDGRVPLPLVAHQQRLVVGQPLGQQTQHHQTRKHHQTPVTQPVAFKAQPGAAGGG